MKKLIYSFFILVHFGSLSGGIAIDLMGLLSLNKGYTIEIPGPKDHRITLHTWDATRMESYHEENVEITHYYSETHMGPFKVWIYKLPNSIANDSVKYKSWMDDLLNKIENDGFSYFKKGHVYGKESVYYCDNSATNFSVNFRNLSERRGLLVAINQFVYRLEIQNIFYLASAWGIYPAFSGTPAYHLGFKIESQNTMIPSWITTTESYRQYQSILNYDWHKLLWANLFCETVQRNILLGRNTYDINIPPKYNIYHRIFYSRLGPFAPKTLFGEYGDSGYFIESIVTLPMVTYMGILKEINHPDFEDPELKVLNMTMFSEIILEYSDPSISMLINEIQSQMDKNGSIDLAWLGLSNKMIVLSWNLGEHEGCPSIELLAENSGKIYRTLFVLKKRRLYQITQSFNSETPQISEEWNKLVSSFHIR